MLDFSNQVVVVTGGSKGIGEGVVRAFAEAGAVVYFTYSKSKQTAEALMHELSDLPVQGYLVDNRDQLAITQFCEKVGKNHGRIDILINNAGVVSNPYLYEETGESWEESIDINLNGVNRYCSAVFPYLKQAPSSSIVNITSMSAERPMLGMSAYAASKAAVESLSRVLALEYAPYLIRVNTVSPGLIDTDIAQNMHDHVRENIIQRTPLKRLGLVHEVVKSVLFLSHPQWASFITGAKIDVTGGKHLD